MSQTCQAFKINLFFGQNFSFSFLFLMGVMPKFNVVSYDFFNGSHLSNKDYYTKSGTLSGLTFM